MDVPGLSNDLVDTLKRMAEKVSRKGAIDSSDLFHDGIALALEIRGKDPLLPDAYITRAFSNHIATSINKFLKDKRMISSIEDHPEALNVPDNNTVRSEDDIITELDRKKLINVISRITAITRKRRR